MKLLIGKFKKIIRALRHRLLLFLKKFIPQKTETTVGDEFRRYRRFHRALADNPYLQSKALWNDMYGSLQTKLDNSYRFIAALLVLFAGSLLGIVWVAEQHTVKPIVTLIHGNEVLTLDHSVNVKPLQPRLALYFTEQFIRDARSVSVDRQVNQQHQVAALSFVQGAAFTVLKDFYQTHPADEFALHIVKSIVIHSILRLSAHTLVVRWQEQTRAVRTGELLKTTTFIAQLHYHYEQPANNAAILRHNPLGFSIDQLAWSNNQTTRQGNPS